METDHNEIAVRFLLGKLTDEEQSDVEQEFFHNKDSFENILIAENSLTDAYVSKRLSPDDRLLFEKRLLISPRQRQKTAFAGTLVKYASQLPVDDIGLAASESKFSDIFARLFSGQPLFSYSLAAAVFLLLVGAAFWWTLYDSHRLADDNLARTNSPAEIESQKPGVREQGPIAEANDSLSLKNTASNAEQTPKPVPDQASPKKDFAPRDKPVPIISTIILPLGSTREVQAAKIFVVPKKTSLVKLQMKFESGHFRSYFVVVETVDGQQVWKGKVYKSREINTENAVTLTVPAIRLRRGDYIIALKGLTKNGTYESVADYSFTVDRR